MLIDAMGFKRFSNLLDLSLDRVWLRAAELIAFGHSSLVIPGVMRDIDVPHVPPTNAGSPKTPSGIRSQAAIYG